MPKQTLAAAASGPQGKLHEAVCNPVKFSRGATYSELDARLHGHDSAKNNFRRIALRLY